jgi:hypothetical protein
LIENTQQVLAFAYMRYPLAVATNTLMIKELPVKSAKDIEVLTAVPGEREWLENFAPLPQNTCFTYKMTYKNLKTHVKRRHKKSKTVNGSKTKSKQRQGRRQRRRTVVTKIPIPTQIRTSSTSPTSLETSRRPNQNRKKMFTCSDSPLF